ncbi:MAG TPA: sigma 54-interacting transcriptional regulator [Candidatus Nitrosotenuis sp.]|nr:sigma 54-interacting transcriptional regulator [Candidatus Nitrosotenuis sp.]
MAVLVIRKGGEMHKEYVFPETEMVLLGRARGNDVCLPDPTQKVSRMHAVIVRAPGGSRRYFIRDLGSLRTTRVGGEVVYQKLLREGDRIQIADYELTYSERAGTSAPRGHLQVVAQKPDPGGLEKSTVLFFGDEILEKLPLSRERRQALEELLPAMAQFGTLAELLQERTEAIARALRADRGFAALFAPSHASRYDEVGWYGLDEGRQIEICDGDFLRKVRDGKTVQDGSTLIVPIYCEQQVLGFFCMDRDAAAPAFTAEDGKFLLALGHMATSRAEMQVRSRTLARAEEELLEWQVEMVGKSRRMTDLRATIEEAAATDRNVLLVGETGTGKEVTARAIHRRSPNRHGPFLARNCAAISESLAETEIFGYAARAGIAGADPKGAPGWFELADGGTLFLDEIHALSGAVQDKFLRVLEERQVWRVHGKAPVEVQVKVIAATDHNLERDVERGEFRRPLYHRFGVRMDLCPLRERPEDIPLLAFFFLDRYASRTRARTRTFSRRALQLLTQYAWPGNVRELENCVAGLVRAEREIVFSWDLPPHIASSGAAVREERMPAPTRSRAASAVRSRGPEPMEAVEKERVLEALEATHGNITRAAELLGFRSRQTMLNKMDRYGIPRDYGDPERHPAPLTGE